MTAFKINIFVPDGNPDGVRIIDKMNWTGVAIKFPRLQWNTVKARAEFNQPGVYILVGHVEEDGLPTLYIGQGEEIRTRLEAHYQNKDFWDWGIAFTSSSNRHSLNRAHITWLEYALVERAKSLRLCHLENGNTPNEPTLAEADKADVRAFLGEIIQILPFGELWALEDRKPLITRTPEKDTPLKPRNGNILDSEDTLLIPAHEDGFKDVFLGQNRWYAVRIAGGKLDKIKYVAAYRTTPISAITHYAPVKSIEMFGDTGKYVINFSGPAKELLKPLTLQDIGLKGNMQSPRYVPLELLTKPKA